MVKIIILFIDFILYADPSNAKEDLDRLTLETKVGLGKVGFRKVSLRKVSLRKVGLGKAGLEKVAWWF